MSWFDDMVTQVWSFIVMIVDWVFSLLMLPDWLYEPTIILIKIIILLLLFSLDLIGIIYLERKLLGRFHNRRSITETGKYGLLQNIADAIKLMIKEDIIPKKADRFLHNVIPILLGFIAILPLAFIPYGPRLYLVNYDTSLLFILAIASLAPGLVLLAGWASNNKFSLIGAFRSGSQMVAYEVPLALSVIGVVMLSGSLNLYSIVEAQKNIWFILVQPLGFITFFISSIIELERAPFDVPEAESELVAGWKTEYGSLKFGLFMGAEYMHLFVTCALLTILYLGGWNGPDFLPPLFWFLLKLHLLIVAFVWVRITFHRFRIDQLLRFGWLRLIPLAILNIILTVLITPYVLPYISL